jgi:hypothetical protein
VGVRFIKAFLFDCRNQTLIWGIMKDLFPFVSVVWDDAWADATDSVGERDHD